MEIYLAILFFLLITGLIFLINAILCRTWTDLAELLIIVADYIDFFNNMRPHQKLGMLTPSAAEAKFSE